MNFNYSIFYMFTLIASLSWGHPKPTLSIQDKHSNKLYTLSSSFLREQPIFRLFDQAFFEAHQLPEQIPARNDIEIVFNKAEIEPLLENFITEIKQGNTTFTDFTILRDRTFNYKLRSGALIAKCKRYPFVIKVFMETPETFSQPFKRGWEPYFLFRMGGGINRHIAGFTRIKNLETINNAIQSSDFWKSRIETPRKWFWRPADDHRLEINGINFPTTNISTSLPCTYCIIADAIEIERTLSLFNTSSAERGLIIKFFNDMNNCIDINCDNFVIEKGTKKLVLIDTEHWPSLIGVTKKPSIQSYPAYALWGVIHIIHNVLFGIKTKDGKTFDT